MKECPYCGGIIDDDSKQCIHCCAELELQCPFCKETISVYDNKCPFCKSKLKGDSISVVVNINYFFVFLNTLIPCWFVNSVNKHPVFWHDVVSKKNDFNDIIQTLVGLAIVFAVPAIIGIVSNYRKRICTVSILLIILLCICNIYIALNIK